MTGLKREDMIVIKDMDINTYPAQDEGTLNSTCISGHPEPSKESGSPRLIYIRYMTVTNISSPSP